MYAYNPDYLIHYGKLGMRWGHRQISRAQAGLNRIESGKHISIGLNKNRQKQYDERDKRIYQHIIDKNQQHLDENNQWHLDKLKKSVTKTRDSYQKYADFRKSHTYATDQFGPNIKEVFIDNPKLLTMAARSDRKTLNLVNSLSKLYPTVSVIPKKDIETGQNYFDILVGNKNARVDFQEN